MLLGLPLFAQGSTTTPRWMRTPHFSFSCDSSWGLERPSFGLLRNGPEGLRANLGPSVSRCFVKAKVALVGQSLKNAIWTYRLTPGTLFRVSRGILHSWRVFLRFAMHIWALDTFSTTWHFGLIRCQRTCSRRTRHDWHQVQ